MTKQSLTFTSPLWLYPSAKAAWYFVTVPHAESMQIKALTRHRKLRGWGSVRVTALVGETEWETSIFPDSKAGTYLLPVKAAVRKKERLAEGTIISVTVTPMDQRQLANPLLV